MARKYSIDDFKDRWDSPFVSDWKPPRQSAKKKTTKNSTKGKTNGKAK